MHKSDIGKQSEPRHDTDRWNMSDAPCGNGDGWRICSDDGRKTMLSSTDRNPEHRTCEQDRHNTGQPVCHSFVERAGKPGGGKGILIQDNQVGTLQVSNNQAIAYPIIGCSWHGDQTSPTLTTCNAGGGQRMPDKENFTCVIVKHKPQDSAILGGYAGDSK